MQIQKIIEKALKKKKEFPSVDPVYIGDRPAAEMNLSVISYDSITAQTEKLSSIEELKRYKDSNKTLWINISGLKDIDSIKYLGEIFNIHPLTIEDILNTEQQPKVETFDEYRFLSIKTIQQEKNPRDDTDVKKKQPFFRNRKTQRNDEENMLNEFVIDQISLIVMENALITFQEVSGDAFDGIRKKIFENVGEIRKAEMDYLAYLIIDAVVDEYSLSLNNMEDVIENYEEQATKTNDSTFIERIQDTKKYLQHIKRAILPLKNNMLLVSHHRMFLKSDDLKPFLQDLNEHINYAITLVENHREWLTNIMDVYLSVLSHQMNKVMKVLATISTIFIPLTFIAGVYGMNFENMPELRSEFGYFITLGGMVFIAMVMILIFRKYRWF